MSFQISDRIYLFASVVTFKHFFGYAGFFTVSFISVLLQFNLWSQKTKMCTNCIETKYCSSSVPVGLYLDRLNHAKAVIREYMFFLILYDPLEIKLEDKEQ